MKFISFLNTPQIFSATQDPVLQVFATTCYYLQRCIEIQDNSGLVLAEEDAVEASECLYQHLVTYQWLTAYFWEQRETLFRVRPKHHYLAHQSFQLKAWKLNQCMFATFDEESFLGKAKAIWQKCHGKTASKRFYDRYLLCLAMMLEEHRRFVTHKSEPN